MKIPIHQVAEVSYAVARAVNLALGADRSPTWENAGAEVREEELAAVAVVINLPPGEAELEVWAPDFEVPDYASNKTVIRQAVVDALR